MDIFNNWLTDHNIPEEIKQFLLQNIFPRGKVIGNVRFDSPENIMEWNEFDLWPNMFDNKLLTIGSAINGDLWTINYRKFPLSVVILPHDDMPSKEDKIIPEYIMIKVADSLEEFMLLAKENKLPLDYYEAKKHNEKK